MSNREALESTLQVLRDLGRIDPIDEAYVTLVRSLADAVDSIPDNANLWKQYRESLEGLLDADGDVDDALSDALEEIRSAAEMGDPPPSEPEDVGSEGGEDGGGAG